MELATELLERRNEMRRRILEWLLWLSIVVFLGVLSLEAASFLIPRSESFLAVGGRLFALLRPGWIDLASDLDASSAPPAPAIVNPRNIIAPRVTRSSSVNLPGFSLTFCLFRNNPAIWSARISLFVPLVLSLFMIAIVFYRLRRLQRRKLAGALEIAAASRSRAG
jgi:hypothetical protein